MAQKNMETPEMIRTPCGLCFLYRKYAVTTINANEINAAKFVMIQ
jgi:hypothetical protein